MCRKVLAVLLTFGWVSLSCFDVVEDLDEIPRNASISSASPEHGSTSTPRGWGPLANNIIESLSRVPKSADFSLVTFTEVISHTTPILNFRPHHELHKLYRVFLI